MLGAVVLLCLAWFPSVAGARTQAPPVTRGGGATVTTVSPPQPDVQPGGSLGSDPESVGVGAPVPVRISTDDGGGGSRPRLWVGAVVGASGVVGLALSAALHRRRRSARALDEPDVATAV